MPKRKVTKPKLTEKAEAAKPPTRHWPGGRKQAIRPGFFIRDYLLEHGEAPPSEIHRELKERYREENENRPKKERLHPPIFASFYRYFLNFYYFGLLELSGKEESRTMYAFRKDLDPRKRAPTLVRVELDKVVEAKLIYYRLTAQGKAEPPHPAWGNPKGVWYSMGGRYVL